MIGIYQIRNTINNKRYIGSSSNIKRRFREHKNGLLNNKHYNVDLQRSFNKYSIQIFKFEILEECLNDELLKKEQYYMDLYGFNKLYNLSPMVYSNLGVKYTSESKHNMSIAHKGKYICKNNSMYGKHHTAETKQKISIAHKGKSKSED